MKIIFVITISLFFETLYAANTQILKCSVSNQEWSSIFVLDAIGSGFLKFKKTGDNNSYTCALKIDYINDGQKAISPNITLEFIRGVCDPDLGALDQEIFDRFTLIVDLTQKNKPEGRVQWLKKKQPDFCNIDKISMFEVSLNAKKWLDGKWGRNTASELKKSSKKGK